MADTIPITLTPAEVAVKMLEHAVAKHNTRCDQIFFKGVSSLYFQNTYEINVLMLWY